MTRIHDAVYGHCSIRHCHKRRCDPHCLLLSAFRSGLTKPRESSTPCPCVKYTHTCCRGLGIAHVHIGAAWDNVPLLKRKWDFRQWDFDRLSVNRISGPRTIHQHLETCPLGLPGLQLRAPACVVSSCAASAPAYDTWVHTANIRTTPWPAFQCIVAVLMGQVDCRISPVV